MNKQFVIATCLATLFLSILAVSSTGRKADHPIENIFLERRSLYDMHRTLSNTEIKPKLLSVFEAARWAPSSYNVQPWKFVYALHGTKAWDKLFSFLVPFNQEWAKNAGALILVISRATLEKSGKPNETHSFDTGLAVENLLLQAVASGLAAHPIGGFDDEKARKDLKIPKEYALEAMIAIGEKADDTNAHKEFQSKDAKASVRKKVTEFAFEGEFKA